MVSNWAQATRASRHLPRAGRWTRPGAPPGPERTTSAPVRYATDSGGQRCTASKRVGTLSQSRCTSSSFSCLQLIRLSIQPSSVGTVVGSALRVDSWLGSGSFPTSSMLVSMVCSVGGSLGDAAVFEDEQQRGGKRSRPGLGRNDVQIEGVFREGHVGGAREREWCGGGAGGAEQRRARRGAGVSRAGTGLGDEVEGSGGRGVRRACSAQACLFGSAPQIAPACQAPDEPPQRFSGARFSAPAHRQVTRPADFARPRRPARALIGTLRSASRARTPPARRHRHRAPSTMLLCWHCVAAWRSQPYAAVRDVCSHGPVRI